MPCLTPPTTFGDLTPVIHFLMELDKLKCVQRKTKVMGTQRQENSAEHSWHFAMAALTIAPYMPHSLDLFKVVKMALLHDIVEIDVGDVLVYDLAAREAIQQQERAAAERIFGLLPTKTAEDFLSCWLEYETGTSIEARFANMLDRLLPILMNLHNEGQSWLENEISLEQVLQRNEAIINQELPELWPYLKQQLLLAQKSGWLK